MKYPKISPLLSQIFQDQPPVAVLRGRLAAKQCSGKRKQRTVQLFFYPPLFHQSHEPPFVLLPRTFPLFVAVENFLGGGQQRLVPVLCAADLANEESQIVALGEPGELRNVVEADVQQLADARAFQKAEELLCRLFCETDGIDFHGAVSISSNNPS